jgi:hypothetical protein
LSESQAHVQELILSLRRLSLKLTMTERKPCMPTSQRRAPHETLLIASLQSLWLEKRQEESR